jgi:uncharacterized protein YndB with AHSA1/START domain
MDIDHSAPAVSTHELLVEAPAQKIWDLLADVDQWSTWNPTAKSAKLSGPFQAGTSFNWKSGGVSIVSTIREVAPASRLVWTGNAIGTRAIHVWSLQSVPGGVLVHTPKPFEGWLVR